jgi:glucose/arabinose dehydrogenase
MVDLESGSIGESSAQTHCNNQPMPHSCERHHDVQRQMLGAMATAMLAGAIAVAAQVTKKAPCDSGNGGITVPPSFCAAVVADNLGSARHMAVSPRGDVYVALSSIKEGKPPGAIVALRDNDGDGRFEQQQHFGTGLTGTGIQWRGDYLYVGADTKLVRFRMSGGALVPSGEPETIVTGFTDERQHSAKPFAFGEHGEVYMHVGAPSNACQNPDRKPGVPGQQPCPLLELYGGVWRYDANQLNQKHSADKRFVTGIRHTVALAWNSTVHSLYAVQHGRDQLNALWPKLFDVRDNAEKPAEEFLRFTEGANFGWPYCYWDPAQNKRVLAPEYGGDGKKEGDCARFSKPLTTFPAHYGPNDLLFYTGAQFPAEYHNGAFVAFHGSWNRAPMPQGGYNVWFVPFKGAEPSGTPRVFADGFAGQTPLMKPDDAKYRPSGLAVAGDGSLYVSEDEKGRIWRISYTGAR